MEIEFRRAKEPETVKEPETIPADVTDHGNREKALTEEPGEKETSPLEEWEIKNGKYGLEFLGIKEIAKEFPMNAQFSVVDKYIKEEIARRGYDRTPESWQNILSEIEESLQSKKLNAYERMKKLSAYINILKKYDKAKALKDLYTS